MSIERLIGRTAVLRGLLNELVELLRISTTRQAHDLQTVDIKASQGRQTSLRKAKSSSLSFSSKLNHTSSRVLGPSPTS